MLTLTIAFGLMGASFGRLGLINKKTTAAPPVSGPGGPGSPMGLLMTLTYSS